jgi:uncharacterized membrane protein
VLSLSWFRSIEMWIAVVLVNFWVWMRSFRIVLQWGVVPHVYGLFSGHGSIGMDCMYQEYGGVSDRGGLLGLKSCVLYV